LGLENFKGSVLSTVWVWRLGENNENVEELCYILYWCVKDHVLHIDKPMPLDI
jgi:hypothetical protein